MLYFAEQKVEVAVLEVGMGGRLDATNIVEPLLSDHYRYFSGSYRMAWIDDCRNRTRKGRDSAQRRNSGYAAARSEVNGP